MAPVVITKLRDMLCRCVMCYAIPAMLRSAYGRRDDRPRIRGSLVG